MSRAPRCRGGEEPEPASESPMAAARRPRWRRWLRRVLLAAVLLPLVAFGMSNVWLATPWGRTVLAGEVAKRCGLETTIGRASWSPWNGLTIGGLVILQPEELRAQTPEPLFEAAGVHIRPDWAALLRKRLRPREVTIERPSLTLTVEMMSHLAQQTEPPPEPPLLAGGKPLPGVAPGPVSPAEAEPSAALPPAEPPAVAEPPVAEPPPAPAPAVAAPTRWLRCHHGSWRLRSAASGKDLLAAREIDLAVPFGGAAAAGHLRLASLTAFGQPALENFEREITWEAPVLTLDALPTATPVAGVPLRFGGQVALIAGLPVTMGVEMPRQQLSLPVPAFELTAESPEAGGQARFFGYLLAPGSWHGDLLVAAATPQVIRPARTFSFDRGGCAAVIRGGTLSFVDARLVGEELSLLGNGTLLADGRLGAVVRIAAPPQVALATAAGVFPALDFTPHTTPWSASQRVALDISLTGTLAEPLVRVGEGAPFLPLNPQPAPPP